VEDFESFEHATNEVLGPSKPSAFGGFFKCDIKKIQGKILGTLKRLFP
jgi:hypothetical protein